MDFCLKIIIPKGNFWILRIGVMGRCQKVPKFDFQSQFFMSKTIGIFLNFYLLKNISLEAHSLLLTFFDNINFWITLLLKWCPIFDSSPLHQFSKCMNFLGWFLGKNLFNFFFNKMLPYFWQLAINPKLKIQ